MVTTKSLALPANQGISIADGSTFDTGNGNDRISGKAVPASTMAPSLSILVMVMTRSRAPEVFTASRTKDL
jgi:hypothetical protein